MVYWILTVIFIGLISGFILFKKSIIPSAAHQSRQNQARLSTPVLGRSQLNSHRPQENQDRLTGSGDWQTGQHQPLQNGARLSIIIPARNEEENLAELLESLSNQTYRPYEIIVVNDFSEDNTREVAQSYEGITVIDNPPLPRDWTGKTWAVWNGFLHATGDILAFFDADLRLTAPESLTSLLKEREQSGGALSVVPYHFTKKFYERLALIANILGVFAFTSPFEKRNAKKGLYGSCIIATRQDYEKVSGHDSIKSELLDDLNLGAKFVAAGVPVQNYLGANLVAFRMYPNGIKSELQGFGKGAILSPASLTAPTIILIALWVIGLIVSESIILFFHTPASVPLAAGYLLYMLQIFYLNKYVGRFGVLVPILHILSTLFFIIIVGYSVYQVAFLKKVSWKGRDIRVGRGRGL